MVSSAFRQRPGRQHHLEWRGWASASLPPARPPRELPSRQHSPGLLPPWGPRGGSAAGPRWSRAGQCHCRSLPSWPPDEPRPLQPGLGQWVAWLLPGNRSASSPSLASFRSLPGAPLPRLSHPSHREDIRNAGVRPVTCIFGTFLGMARFRCLGTIPPARKVLSACFGPWNREGDGRGQGFQRTE